MQERFPTPHYAVIFTSTLSDATEGYDQMATRMGELAAEQAGYLGIDSVREGKLGITVSYWKDEAAIANWKRNLEHLTAQKGGRGGWYESFSVRVSKVERSYDFDSKA